jgi:hypothetical protein
MRREMPFLAAHGAGSASTPGVETVMDDLTFDHLTRFVGRFTSRRGALRGLAGAAVASALAEPPFVTKAKKKKKKKKKTCKAPNTKCGKTGCCQPNQRCQNGACQGPCIFTETPGRWTLQRDCIAQSPITIPSDTTLDGDGHTIFLLGSTQILTYGVGTAGGNVDIENLTVDGSGVTGTCAERGIGIRYTNASGSIRNSSVTGLTSTTSCGFAISVVTPDGAPRTITIDTVEITDSLAGISVSALGKVDLDVKECTIRGVNFGIQIDYNVEASIVDNVIEANTYGVVATSSASVNAAPDVTATGNRVNVARIGMSVAAAQASPGTAIPRLAATGNTIETIEGRSQDQGLYFGKQAAGSASGNTISKFACGIFVTNDAGDVDVGTNTFPNPEGTPDGNGQDECGVP